jgi:hypothetical protein
MIGAAVPLCAAAGSGHKAAHMITTALDIVARVIRSRQFERDATDHIIPPHSRARKMRRIVA